MGTYLRVQKPIILESNQLINIGGSFLLVSTSDLKEPFMPFLKAKVLGGPNNGRMFCLDPVLGKKYLLGRSEDCELHLADSVLS